MGRRKRVDEVLSEKRRAAGSKGGFATAKRHRLLQQKLEDLLQQNDPGALFKNAPVDQVKADIGATKVARKRPRKPPSGGVGGVQQPPCKSTVKVKTNCKDKSTTKKTARVRNEIWDTVCDVYGFKPVTKNEQSRVGKIVRDLKLKGATPDDIRTRAGHYRQRWPKMSFTPEALLKHWDSLAEPDHTEGSRVRAKPGKYANVKTIDLRGPEPPVLPFEAAAPDLADADQGSRVEEDRPAASGDDDFPF